MASLDYNRGLTAATTKALRKSHRGNVGGRGISYRAPGLDALMDGPNEWSPTPVKPPLRQADSGVNLGRAGVAIENGASSVDGRAVDVRR